MDSTTEATVFIKFTCIYPAPLEVKTGGQGSMYSLLLWEAFHRREIFYSPKKLVGVFFLSVRRLIQRPQKVPLWM